MKFSLLMPYYGESNSVVVALQSVLTQDMHPAQIVLIDNGSPISLHDVLARSTVVDVMKRSSIELCIFRKELNGGLAGAYNTGLSICEHEIIVIMQPDIVLPTHSSIKILLAAFESTDVVIVGHVNSPVEDSYWRERTLFEKAILAPSESSRAHGFNGQFDAFQKSIADSVGGFNEARYRTAGEDGDFVRRMSKVGKFVITAARAEHRHNFSGTSGFGLCIRKSFQYGNAQGASVRHGGGISPLFREVAFLLGLILILLKPNLTWISIGVWLISSIRIPYLVYRRDRRLFQGLCLIGVEFLRFFGHVSGAVVGLILGRQSI